jgi:hypothetical protein
METYASGALYWDTTDAAAPRWVLLLNQPGDDPMRLDPQDLFTPQDASTYQLLELIGTTFHKETGQLPEKVTLTPVEQEQRYQFRVTYTY